MIVTYDTSRELWRFYWDSYWGGERYRTPSATRLSDARLQWQGIDESGRPVPRSAQRSSYLVPHPMESDSDYDARLSLATYVNLVQPVVKAYSESITAGVQRDLGLLAPWCEDVDQRGSPWGELVEEVARWAAVYGLLFCLVDAPLAGETEQPYAVLVQPTAVVLLECDPRGRITRFAYLDSPYQSLDATTCEVQVREWRADTAAGPGYWAVRQGQVSTAQSVGSQFDALKVVATGPLPAVLGGKLPITVAYYERDSSQPYPYGASLIADASDLSRVIYNSLSWASEIHRKAGFPFLAIPMASTGGQLDKATRLAVGPGKGLGYDSSSGAPSYVAPSPESSKELREHCVYLAQWLLRTCGLEVAADSSAQVQSGEALRVRSRDFEARASRFARSLQRWEVATLRLLALLGGKSGETVTVNYPKRFTLPDLSEDLDRALKLLAAPVEIGAPLKSAAIRQAVSSALTLSDTDLADGMAEVDAILLADAEAALNAAAAGGGQGLNGAQFASVAGIVESVAARRIPVASGQKLIEIGLPTSPETAVAIIADAGSGFAQVVPE